MRKAITYLQSVARLKGDEEVSKADVFEIAGASKPVKHFVNFVGYDIKYVSPIKSTWLGW